MIITTVPDHPAPMYVSRPTYAVSAKMAKDTVYMPSQVTARLLGSASPEPRRDDANDAPQSS